MKTHYLQTIVVSVLCVGGLQAADAPAKPDATGVWVAEFQGRDGQTRRFETTLIQEGTKLSGHTQSFRGQSIKISDGKVEGNRVSYSVGRESPRGRFEISYTGALEGDTLTGQMSGKMGERTFEREWTVKRQPGDPVGKWAWSMERDNGEKWEADLVIKKEGDKLSGEFTRDEAGWSLPMKEPKLKGNLLTFKTILDNNGEEIVIKNSARIAGKVMIGHSRGSRDGQEWSRLWKAEKKTAEE